MPDGNSPNGFKRGLGLFLFWISWLLWGLMLVAPFLIDAEASTIAVAATTLLVAAELSFAASLLLLGRPFYDAFKAKLRPLWRRVRGSNE
ncbi:hypothetical protein Ga0123462_1624 [Mariprofundus ferrinatatus]|uniref:Transporter suffix domain-containing protein n=1 Tax=Mariprofundus ferrinatatus TaxID=1921087 RepID=A0A2K8L5W0_9PROT|nr:hypothetical protein [Mariprofundus ferrinatatus]ATX82482.1 hypothetical protein Ga0123462_1624 [Mariprofundus ferrinatatus]